MTLVKGDRFIHYGKNKTVKGVVEKVTERVAFDLVYGVKVTKITITSKDGEKFDSNQCRKIVGDILPNFIKKLRNLRFT